LARPKFSHKPQDIKKDSGELVLSGSRKSCSAFAVRSLFFRKLSTQENYPVPGLPSSFCRLSLKKNAFSEFIHVIQLN
jgi:hypothetical protein